MSKKSRKNSSKPASAGRRGARTAAKAATKPGKPRVRAARSPGSTSRKSESPAALASRPTSATTAKPTSAAEPSGTGGHLADGAIAPAFTLPRDGGSSVSLTDFRGRKLVLFFYPRADTPGCTREAIDFTRLSKAFAESGTAILGISADSLKAQEAFRDKHGLSVPLISDTQHQMLEAYGAWGEKSMYGRKFQGILRTTVLIDAQSRIARVWRNVRVDGHAEEVLAEAQAL